MHLLHETKIYFVWLLRVLLVFLRVCSGTTTMAVGVTVLGRIAKLLAFFLPLKVILLAGSTGVPRYFPFIDPSDKTGWIIGLTIGAFVAYILSLVFDRVADRLCMSGSAAVVERATELAVVSQQGVRARAYYGDFVQVAADGLFVAIGMLVLAWLNPELALLLFVLLVGQYLFTVVVMAGSEDVVPSRTKAYIKTKLKNYLEVLASINFLAGFLVLLAPFVLGIGGNLLIAILSIILLRQTLGSIQGGIKTWVDLAADRPTIDTLVFPKVKFQPLERKARRELRDLFAKERRQARVEAELVEKLDEEQGVEVCWADPVTPNTYTFLITANKVGTTENQHYQQQVVPERFAHVFDNEEFLFRHVPRAYCWAPEIVARFKEGPFDCRICEYGTGQPVGKQEWFRYRLELRERLWGFAPPRELLDAYRTSKRLLHERLNRELFERLWVAVDTKEEGENLEKFLAFLPSVTKRLKKVPLYVYNPWLKLDFAVATANGGVFVVRWGQWSLEPLGGGLNDLAHEKHLLELLPELVKRRADIKKPLAEADIRLAALCAGLEAKISQGRYKAALAIMEEICSLQWPGGVADSASKEKMPGEQGG
ncbi:hypothetical protein [Desulfurivibrio alkaliphilus]|uniref:Uncharacterized protein n=1 Tax=Desulfurivibrio alkaliphilus (strain DSM 19089 / UNIQEM U267 / AHT2) TaxID=589865 RepID=D6Z4M7_DESAT|nr:hypothetical protein [Desulfurivibrio alkaliphilus]ADH86502.1 hypothetical protein DaAHT2_1811 [Desulfurivibrio alkaliphilus AHT 2]